MLGGDGNGEVLLFRWIAWYYAWLGVAVVLLNWVVYIYMIGPTEGIFEYSGLYLYICFDLHHLI